MRELCFWQRATLIVAAFAAAVPARADIPELPGHGTPALPDADYARALDCLTAAIAYEAGFEPAAGQAAVAEVVLNRARHPAYPKSVCGVIFAGASRKTGCQFTFTCDGALARRLPAAVLAASRQVAVAALAGTTAGQIGAATHYHANYVSPYWAPSLVRVATIGAHVFYRLPGAADVPPATGFAPRGEPAIAALAGIDHAAGTVPVAAPPRRALPPVFAPWGLVPGAGR